MDSSYNLAKWWIAIAGIVLIVVGVLGFITNPLVGDTSDVLIPTGPVHNIVHIATGLLALYIAFGLSGSNLVNGVIGFGVLYVVIFLAVVLSPTLFGLFNVAANAILHVIHAALALVSLGVGFMARGSVSTTMNQRPIA